MAEGRGSSASRRVKKEEPLEKYYSACLVKYGVGRSGYFSHGLIGKVKAELVELREALRARKSTREDHREQELYDCMIEKLNSIIVDLVSRIGSFN